LPIASIKPLYEGIRWENKAKKKERKKNTLFLLPRPRIAALKPREPK
jgi:hypothetical protein